MFSLRRMIGLRKMGGALASSPVPTLISTGSTSSEAVLVQTLLPAFDQAVLGRFDPPNRMIRAYKVVTDAERGIYRCKLEHNEKRLGPTKKYMFNSPADLRRHYFDEHTDMFPAKFGRNKNKEDEKVVIECQCGAMFDDKDLYKEHLNSPFEDADGNPLFGCPIVGGSRGATQKVLASELRESNRNRK